MLEQDERESEGVEVRPEEKTSESGVGEVSTGPRLFSELGTGITTGDGAEEGAIESEEVTVPAPPILTGRRKGGPFRRVVKAEAQADEEGVTLSGEQRLLVLDGKRPTNRTFRSAAARGMIAFSWGGDHHDGEAIESQGISQIDGILSQRDGGSESWGAPR